MKSIILPVLLASTILISCGHAEEAQHHSTTLPVSSPVRMDTSITKTYVCQIRAKNHIGLRAQERGYIQHIYVDEGEKVHEGQLLFQIMPNLYEAELNKAQAEADYTRIEYDNTAALADKGVVSQNEVSLARAKYDKALADVELARTHLSFTRITAPFDGLVDKLEVRLGSLVDDGELLTYLSDNSQLWVYFNVPETEYLAYANSPHQDDWGVKLTMANGAQFSEHGIVETVEADFDNETGNIPFRATFTNPNGILRHGETGNIVVSTPLRNALIIPQKATYEVLEKKYVFVVTSENTIEAREVHVSAEIPHLYVISEGLKESDRILLEGLRLVRPGDIIDPEFIEPEDAINGLNLYAE